MLSWADGWGMDGFLTIPSVSLRRSQVVVANQDEYQEFYLGDRKVPPIDLFKKLFEHYEVVHILDLDGVEKGSPNVGLIQKISEIGEVWVDAGISDADTLIDLFMAGSAESVVSSKTLKGMRELVNGVEMCENLMFQVDYDNGVMARSETISQMKISELIGEVMDLGIYQFIVADFTNFEEKKKPNKALFKKILKKHKDVELFAAVRVRPKDIPDLEELGLAGAFIDMRSALKEKGITF